jgi:hypothetical protein
MSMDFYVSTLGNNDGKGTNNLPFQTIQRAMDEMNRCKQYYDEDMSIILMDGTYILESPFIIDGSDQLTNNRTITLKADKESSPIISGGIRVTDWHPVKYNGMTMYKVRLPEVYNVREFYVNNEKRTLARTSEVKWHYAEIEGEIESQGFKVDKPALNSGIIIDEPEKIDLKAIKSPTQLEFCTHNDWRYYIVPCDSIHDNKISMSSNFQAITGQYDTNTHMAVWLPNPCLSFKHNTVYFQNDVSLIKAQGEFAFDSTERELYYYPLEGEDITKQVCYVPYLDRIIELRGTKENNISNIRLEGISFKHGDFSEMSKQGFAVHQADNYVSGESHGKEYVPKIISGNIHITYGKNICIKNCRFENLVATAIRFEGFAVNCTIENNIFRNIGSSAISSDVFEDTSISNNIIHSFSKVMKSTTAIMVYDAVRLRIEHNDLYDGPYTGISVGWGWGAKANPFSNEVLIRFNKIGNIMNEIEDGGAIYTLDKQYNSVIEGNYIYDVKKGNCIYNDEGTRGYVVRNNVLQNRNSNEELQNSLVANRLYPMSDNTGVRDLIYENNFSNDQKLTVNEIVTVDEGLGEAIPDILNGTQITKLNIKEYGTRFEPNATSESKWSEDAKKIIAFSGLEQKTKYLYSALES